MNQKQIKKLVSLILCAGLLLFPTTGTALNQNDSFITKPNVLSTTTLSFSEETSSSGYFIVSATTPQMPTFLTAEVTLQSAPAGSKNFSNVAEVSPLSKTVKNTNHISFHEYFPISSSQEYRIKVTFTDDCTGNITASTYYKTLIR